jgi:hypothetical protein
LCSSSMRFSSALSAIFPPVHVFTSTVSAAWASPESSADAPKAAVTAIKAAASNVVACFMDVRPPPGIVSSYSSPSA